MEEIGQKASCGGGAAAGVIDENGQGTGAYAG
jgi:hypothetical protein